MKIFVIGGAGSGKSTLANLLAPRLNVPVINLDDLFWENSKENYGIRRSEEERNHLLQNILNKDSWIIEGAFVEWPMNAILAADTIIYLKTSNACWIGRLVLRYFKRKFGLEINRKRESLKGMIDLIIWNFGQIRKIDALITEIQLDQSIVVINNLNELNRIDLDNLFQFGQKHEHPHETT